MPLLEGIRNAADAVYNIVLCGHGAEPAVAADTFEKARGGGVGYDRLYVEVARKLFERGVMLLVGALLALSAAVE